MTTQAGTRIEKDSLGTMEVPASAYYGAQTRRAELNFPISDLRLNRRFLRTLAQIKRAAAEVNRELGVIDDQVADAIVRASDEVMEGRLHSHFVVDVFQTGSGTSTNMNMNEVISNRAIELLGGQLGSKDPVHPNDHVNFGQSSNDTIPTAMQVAGLLAIKDDLLPALERLREALTRKSEEFWPIIKTGRTHLQDATPIRLGQEFLGYRGQVDRAIRLLGHAMDELAEVPLGGTAVGTGVNAHEEFARRVTEKLSAWNHVTIRETTNHFQAQSTIDAVVEASGVLNTIAASFMKMANDIRWLGSGPRAGLYELQLPEVQPGSSIMPGKVNPVIAESLLMVCAQVIGNHTTVTICGQWGNFELNVMMPVAAFNLLQSIELLAKASANFAGQCIEGLKATERGPEMVEKGLAICTGLAPRIGYDAAADISKEAFKTGQTIREVARERTSLSEAELDELLDPVAMTEPGLGSGPSVG
ncbi:MAG: class II fumarate hydratase [Dehalococcoidia bacterium]